MKVLLLLIVLVAAGCGQQPLAFDLPEGVTCSDEALDTIRENPPDERADTDSPEYTEFYSFSYYRSAGCDTPTPSIQTLP